MTIQRVREILEDEAINLEDQEILALIQSFSSISDLIISLAVENNQINNIEDGDS